MTALPQRVSSRDNPLFKELRKLARDSSAYRSQRRVWLEGDHLCGAALARGVTPAVAVFSESKWPPQRASWTDAAIKTIVLSDPLFASVSPLESPAGMAFVIDLPIEAGIEPALATVVLDRIQDAGNVGSILRSAAAFGVGQVIALQGTAALWSSKVLRAAMGAHFGLRLVEGSDMDALRSLALPLIATSSHRGELLGSIALPAPCAWVFGHEGGGVSGNIDALASLHVRIAQRGGEESLNVAAAAAICLYASAG